MSGIIERSNYQIFNAVNTQKIKSAGEQVSLLKFRKPNSKLTSKNKSLFRQNTHNVLLKTYGIYDQINKK